MLRGAAGNVALYPFTPSLYCPLLGEHQRTSDHGAASVETAPAGTAVATGEPCPALWEAASYWRSKSELAVLSSRALGQHDSRFTALVKLSSCGGGGALSDGSRAAIIEVEVCCPTGAILGCG